MPAIRIEIQDASLVNHGDGTVILDLDGLAEVCLDIQRVQILDANGRRDLTEREERDLEEALDSFYVKRLADALAGRIKRL